MLPMTSMSGRLPKPNFFIVGAPKAGTTAFYVFLKQHPQIFCPETAKEPHFFAPEFRHPAFVQDPAEYAALFANARAQPRLGEASVFYLYSREAASRIYEAGPESRIIMMLRNPVEMVYALYHEHVTNGIERYRSFPDALAAEERRATGVERVPASVSPELFLYRRIGRYAAQVGRYLETFPREQLHFIFFEDFTRDTAAEYERTLRFLGVDDAFKPEFSRVNENRRVRNRTLQCFLLARPAFIQKAVRALSPEGLRHRLLNLAFHFNAPIAPRPPLDPRTRQQLVDYFAPDITELSALTGRDLSSWLKETGTPAPPRAMTPAIA